MKIRKIMKAITVVTIFSGVIAVWGCFSAYKKRMKILEEKNVKFKKYYNLLNEWKKQDKKENDNKLERYLKEHNLNKIAIYGMGEIGQRLLEELKDTNIDVICGIDQYGNTDLDMNILEPDDLYEIADSIDGVIVTAIADYEAVKETIGYINKKIISLEEIIYNL